MAKQKDPPFLDRPLSDEERQKGEWNITWFEWLRDIQNLINERPALGSTVEINELLVLDENDELVSGTSVFNELTYEAIIQHLLDVVHLTENLLPDAGTEWGARFGSYKIGLLTENDYAYFDEYGKLIFYGTNTGLQIISVANAGTVEKFAVFDSSGNINYRTAAQLITDLKVELNTQIGSQFITENLVPEAGTTPFGFSKIIANSITINDGTSADTVTDLQYSNDGNVYHLVEAATTPGQQLIIDFVDVVDFYYVHVLCVYEGSTSHALEIELYNWDKKDWDHIDSIQSGHSETGTIFKNHQTIMPDIKSYLGRNDNKGRVRLRINHPMLGNVSHNSYIDEVALFRNAY